MRVGIFSLPLQYINKPIIIKTMDKLFIVEIDWNIKGETGHDILAVTTAENVKECFKMFVEMEKSESYLQDFFNEDGTVKEGVMDDFSEYIDTDTSFMFATKDYEYYTEMSIREKTIWTPNATE